MSHEEFAALVELIEDLIRHRHHVTTHPNDRTRHTHDEDRRKEILDRAREQLIL